MKGGRKKKKKKKSGVRKRVRHVVKRRKDEEEEWCNTCKEESDVVYDFSSGNMVCRTCAKVLSTHEMDMGADWFVSEGARADVHPSEDLSTGIKDPQGALRHTFYKSKSDRQRGLAGVYREMQDLCDRIHLTRKITEHAKRLYMLLWKKRANLGRKQIVFQAACIYMACKLYGAQRTLNEIVALTKVRRRDLTRTFSNIKTVLQLDAKLAQMVAASGAFTFVHRFCDTLDLGMWVGLCAERLCKRIKKRQLMQMKHPSTIACGVILALCHLSEREHDISAHDIAEISAVSITTITECKKRILALISEKRLKLPQLFTEKERCF